jgi:prostaglandin-H2 D-isomerase / glutathione transferase
MMTKLQNCVLTYFDIPGRGEATRLALTIGGIAFEDHRIPFTQWGELKPKTPWGSMPMLDLQDGSKLAQQRAILRLVGKETGLYPTTTTEDSCWTCAKIDELMDAADDLPVTISGIGKGMPEDEKLAARQAACVAGGAMHGILTRLDAFVAANGNKDGHVVGDQLTIADLFLFTNCSNLVSGMFDGVPLDTLEPFPHIQACRKMVRNHPIVKKYYETTTHKIPPSYALIM